MWQRFTERARKVVFYGQEEAQRFGEGYVSTEHLLLGLLREENGVAMRAFEKMGIVTSKVRVEVERQLPRGEARPAQDMTLTPRAKRVIDLAYDEARNLDNNYIGTEHLLLGLVREGDGLAGRVLAKFGIDLGVARLIVMELQGAECASGLASKASQKLQPARRNYKPVFITGEIIDLPLLVFLMAVSGENAIARKILEGLDVDANRLQYLAETQVLAQTQPLSNLTFDQMLKVASESAAERGRPLNSGDLLVAMVQLDPEHDPVSRLGGVAVDQLKETLRVIDVD